MGNMIWMGSRPQVLDNEGYEWVQSRFVFLFLIIAEANNVIFFGCNF